MKNYLGIMIVIKKKEHKGGGQKKKEKSRVERQKEGCGWKDWDNADGKQMGR